MKLTVINSQKRSFYNELVINTYVSAVDVTVEELNALRSITECDYIGLGELASLDRTIHRGEHIWFNADSRVADDYGKFIIGKDEEVVISEEEIEIEVIGKTADTLDERVWKILFEDNEGKYFENQIRLDVVEDSKHREIVDGKEVSSIKEWLCEQCGEEIAERHMAVIEKRMEESNEIAYLINGKMHVLRIKQSHGGPRPGAGRKPVDKVKMLFSLERDTVEAINEISAEMNIGKSSVVDNAVKIMKERK